MQNRNLGTLFRKKRISQGISLGQVAEALGYKNKAKGANHVKHLEDEGIITTDFCFRLAGYLGVSVEEVNHAHQKDCQAFQDWLNEPIDPHLIVRWIPGFYVGEQLPLHVGTSEKAIQYAADRCNSIKRKACLILSRKERVWLNEDGSVNHHDLDPEGRSHGPSMSTNKGRFVFELKG